MITYFMNWMGPVSMKWYEKNNIPYKETWITFKNLRKYGIKTEPRMVKKYLQEYCCGRIDVSGVPGEPCGIEYGVGMITKESWMAMVDYLKDLKTTSVLSKDELFHKFESDTGQKIQWFKGE